MRKPGRATNALPESGEKVDLEVTGFKMSYPFRDPKEKKINKPVQT